MNDLNWERSCPPKTVSPGALTKVLQSYRAGAVVCALTPVSVGCRNSNFVLQTEREKLFLRLTDSASNNERAAWSLLHESVRMPQLLSEGELDGSYFLLYGYAEGLSLQQHINTAGSCSPEIAAQAARMAARLHSLDPALMASVNVFTPPPFATWYDLFLKNPLVQDALGGPLIARVRKMLMREEEAIQKISAEPSVPIHADFRPANMLIDAAGQICITDWESFGLGHALGDVGQFFRFRKQFGPAAMHAFETVYNAEAARPLPENWERLALLRDLVNPLQMLGRSWDAPRAKADLLELVRCTLDQLDA